MTIHTHIYKYMAIYTHIYIYIYIYDFAKVTPYLGAFFSLSLPVPFRYPSGILPVCGYFCILFPSAP